MSEGFSREAARRIVAPQKASTLSIYQSRWNGFERWCEPKGIDPYQASVPQISEFFLHLFHEKKAVVGTIRGYRTAICGTLVDSGRSNMASNRPLTKMIESLNRERPPTGNIAPKWDLAFVLWMLTEAPFEPLKLTELKFLSWKTLFLVLLASGARRSEVHAVDWKRVDFGPNFERAVLYPVVEFVNKTQISRSGAKKPKVITFPALAPLCSSGMSAEKSLCPVRALKVYLSRTHDLRQGEQRTLFVSMDKSRHHHKAIHKNTLSGWVRHTIQYCYEHATDGSARLVNARAHDLRGMATTLAFQGSAEMEDILQAGSWTTPNTFISHYLKQSVITPEGKYKIGPVVAGQQIV